MKTKPVMTPWIFADEEEIGMSADLRKKPYAQSTIDGLKSVKERNDTRRQRAVSTLSRLAFPGRARRRGK